MSIALIKNNNVILGPMPWNYLVFKEELERCGVNFPDLPEQTPSDLPMNFDNGVSIVFVIRNIPDHTPETQFLTGPTWDFEKNPVEATYGVGDYPIDYAKASIKYLLKMKRSEREENTSINYTFQDKTLRFKIKREERNYIASLLSSISSNSTINFKSDSTEGKVFVTLSKTDLENICIAINTEVQNLFNWEKDKFDQIESAQDISTLNNISF